MDRIKNLSHSVNPYFMDPTLAIWINKKLGYNIFMTIAEFVEKSKSLHYAKPNDIALFVNKLKHPPYTRDEGSTEHYTTYFVPFHKPTQSLFAGAHKKSGLFIPPGGHIDCGEGPIDSVIREFKEELSYVITSEMITFFQITSIDIHNREKCSRHLEFGFRVNLPEKINFKYDRREFHDAYWLTIPEFLKKDSYDAVKEEIKILQSLP